MRILGIDYGAKRIGIAISDEAGRIAFPKGIIKNDAHTLKHLEKLLIDEEIGAIVIGESLDLSGVENKIQQKIKIFKEELEQSSGIKVFFQKEFMTSFEARKTTIFKSDKDQTGASSRMKKETNGKIDDKAAMLILQRYLDKENIKNNLN